jgi:lysophospholipase L1-like esterase
VLRAAAVLAAAVLGVGTLTAAVATRPATPPPDLVAPDRPDDGPLHATPSATPTRSVANPGPSAAASAPPSSSSASSSSESSSPVTAPPAPTAPSGTAPAESSAATPARTVAAYGDSVMLGARPELRAAGIRTNAAESRQFAAMVDLVEKARAKGRLADVVVVHGGTNGPIRERDLRRLVRATRGSILVLVNDHVPRAWERRNNKLLAAVASGHADVHVVDWDALASRRPRWLYDDGTHLRPGAAREGYARLLQRAVRSLP